MANFASPTGRGAPPLPTNPLKLTPGEYREALERDIVEKKQIQSLLHSPSCTPPPPKPTPFPSSSSPLHGFSPNRPGTVQRGRASQLGGGAMAGLMRGEMESPGEQQQQQQMHCGGGGDLEELWRENQHLKMLLGRYQARYGSL